MLIPPHNFGVGHFVISGFRDLGMYFKMIYNVNNANLSTSIIIIIIIINWTTRDGKKHNQSDHILIGDGIHACSMCDLSGELTLILVTFWWLKKLGKDLQ